MSCFVLFSSNRMEWFSSRTQPWDRARVLKAASAGFIAFAAPLLQTRESCPISQNAGLWVLEHRGSPPAMSGVPWGWFVVLGWGCPAGGAPCLWPGWNKPWVPFWAGSWPLQRVRHSGQHELQSSEPSLGWWNVQIVFFCVCSLWVPVPRGWHWQLCPSLPPERMETHKPHPFPGDIPTLSACALLPPGGKTSMTTANIWLGGLRIDPELMNPIVNHLLDISGIVDFGSQSE